MARYVFLLIVSLTNHASKKEALEVDVSGQFKQFYRSKLNPMLPKVI